MDFPIPSPPNRDRLGRGLERIHHGPFVPLIYVQHAVAVTNRLKPDLICLVGDYVHRSGKYIGPSINALGALRASSGVYAVLGNHDHWEGAEETRAALKANGFPDLTNRGIWIERGPYRVRLGGVGDLWEDVQELDGTLEGVQDRDTALLLSHNPDYVEKITDCRISLVFSGHTHGGQVVIPLIGPPLVPSSYGRKYASGYGAATERSRLAGDRDRRFPIPGTLLVRDFHGRRIMAKVLDHGFEYDGRLFKSLSAIAREVTGTRWNGLAFFGNAGKEVTA